MNTTFVDGTTTVVATWLNDINVSVYEAIGDGTNTPTTPTEVKTNLGLENVDNTSDLSKPISTTTQTALNLKQDSATAVTLTGTQTLTNKTLTTPIVNTNVNFSGVSGVIQVGGVDKLIVGPTTIAPAAGVTMVGNGPVVRAATSSQSISNAGSSQIVAFSAEYTDTDSAWNGSRFQPPIAGYYLITSSIKFSSIAAAGDRTISIRRNGTEVLATNSVVGVSGNTTTVPVNNIVLLNGSTDYVETTAYQVSGSPLALDGSAFGNFFSAVLVRSA